MSTLLQTYGIWILIALSLLFMMRMHSAGGGCCMGHQHGGGHDAHRSEHGGAFDTPQHRDTASARDNAECGSAVAGDREPELVGAREGSAPRRHSACH